MTYRQDEFDSWFEFDGVPDNNVLERLDDGDKRYCKEYPELREFIEVGDDLSYHFDHEHGDLEPLEEAKPHEEA